MTPSLVSLGDPQPPDGVHLAATPSRLVLTATADVAGLASGDFARPRFLVPLNLDWFGPDPRFVGFSYAQFVMPVWAGADLGFDWSPASNVDSPAAVLPLMSQARDGTVCLLAPLSGWHDQLVAIADSPASRRVGWGWHGDLDVVPAGTTTELGIYRGTSATDVLAQWRADLDITARANPHHPLLSHLSYWTDNGAAYWYRTEPGVAIADAIANKIAELDDLGVAIGSVELDSWFYQHEVSRSVAEIGYLDEVPPTGMIEWQPRPDVLPRGMADIVERVGGRPLVLHSRHISTQSPYVLAGDWWEDVGAHPVDPAFFDRWFDDAAVWGANCIEQDWMLHVWFGLRQLRERPGRAMTWLSQLDAAATRTGVAVMFCMVTPGDLIAAAELGQVVAVRTCDDYRYADDPARLWRWYLTVNRLADTLGLPVSKDCFFTGGDPGDSGLDGDPHNQVEALLSALSGGVVGIGDRIGRTDVDIISRLCRPDGLLVKPDRPLAICDVSLFAGPDDNTVTWAETATGSWRYIVGLHLGPTENSCLGEFEFDETMLVYNWRTGTAEPADHVSVDLDRRDWALFVCCPIEVGDNGRRSALIGDPTKLATMGRTRVDTTGTPRINLAATEPSATLRWWHEGVGIVDQPFTQTAS